MLRITISATPADPMMEVRRGQTASVQISGTYRSDDDPNVLVTVIARGVLYPATVNTATRRWQSTISVTGPSRTHVFATLHAKVRDPQGNLIARTLQSRPRLVIAREAQDDPGYLLSGTVVDSRGAPLIGLEVAAWDLDRRSRADRLGIAVSDDNGNVSFPFRESAFTEDAGEGGPDIKFEVRDGNQVLPSTLVGWRGNWIPAAPIDLPPFTLRVANTLGALLSDAVRAKWIGAGGSAGFLGRPLGDEIALPGGARFAQFAGGSIFVHPQFGAKLLYGLIRARWQALGGEGSFLGLPVTDEIDDPIAPGARASVFEHGVIRWQPGQVQAVETGHDFARIHGQVRAQILARFFAVGRGGRRNIFSYHNQLDAPVPEVGPNVTRQDADKARWRIAKHCGENPFLYGVNLIASLAVEEQAGNLESRVALQEWLATTRALSRWEHTGSQGAGRLPLRWGPGTPVDQVHAREQFIAAGPQWTIMVPPADRHLQAARPIDNLRALLGPRAAEQYHKHSREEGSNHYRRWELSMDELVGLVTSYWLIARLSTTQSLRAEVARQAALVGNYLADHGYMLVRPQGGFAWQGYGETLPAMEFPISRALAFAFGGGPDFRSRADIVQVLKLAGHWDQMSGPMLGWQALGYSLTLATLGSSPIILALGLNVGVAANVATLVFAGQLLTPEVLGAAAALYLHRDAFDVLLSKTESQNNAGVALGSLLMASQNKAALYRNLTGVIARFGKASEAWAVHFPGTLCLTGLDDTTDPTLRLTYLDWFATRRQRPDEIKGLGSGTIRASAVQVLMAGNDGPEEARLVGLLDRAVVELFRDSYFDPQLPTDGPASQTPHEYAYFPWERYRDDPNTPHSPADFLAAHALASWHALRRRTDGSPVTTPRFPSPLTDVTMKDWPPASVPDYALAELTARGCPIEALQGTSAPVRDADRRYHVLSAQVPSAQPQPTAWPGPNVLLADVTVTVDARMPGEVATGITIHPGFEFSIESSGQIWAGRVLDPQHDAEGQPIPVHDARWPLHTGLDPAANKYCLLGRLNGWFRIGNRFTRRRWELPYARPLFLRINDGERIAGSGAYQARIRVWGTAGAHSPPVHRVPQPLEHDAVLGTSDPKDLIEVSIEPAQVGPNLVRIELAMDAPLSARKELRIEGLAQPTMIFTEGATRTAFFDIPVANLAACTIALSKRVFLGMVQVRLLGNLSTLPAGSKVQLFWVFD